MINLLNKIWETAEKRDTKLNKRLYRYLNLDYVNGIEVTEDDTWWIELNGGYLPKYLFDYIKRIARLYGLTYIYDLEYKLPGHDETVSSLEKIKVVRA